jgi:NADH dehydrogenase
MIAAAAGTTKVALPAPVMLLKLLAAALDQYAFFPITRDQLTMLMQGNTCGGQDAFQTFGLEPVPFNTTGLAYLQDDD